MSSSRGTMENGVAIFSNQDSLEVEFLGDHTVPVITIAGVESAPVPETTQPEKGGKIMFTTSNVTKKGFTINASGPFTGKVFYIISSEGI